MCEPVSYTHLDVYKRQLLAMEEIKEFQVGLATFIDSSKVTLQQHSISAGYYFKNLFPQTELILGLKRFLDSMMHIAIKAFCLKYYYQNDHCCTPLYKNYSD